ncbi:alpha/beta hydrolase family protein [Roseateles sp.]|uniref:alpha/beta hydrolase family protein n=1 Tax=Roseateles sp. TaxID=1971397 RepID=UPI003BA5FDDD
MNELFLRISLAGLALLMTGAAVAQETISLSRQDQQAVTVTAYAPKRAGCQGIAIVSPGAGGSEKGYPYLGEAMASLGYLALVIGHRESGRDALREHMRGHGLRAGLSELITDPKAYRGRFMDIAAAKAWASSRCNAPESILIGHSMGAATTMMEAGARNKLGVKGADRFSAYIALSPQGAGTIFPRNAWSDIKRPVLSITGTRDNELGGASWQTRTEPFQDMPAACKWLAVIEGATHMNFAGNGISRRTETLSTQVIADFLEGMRRGDCKPMLQSQGLEIQSK